MALVAFVSIVAICVRKRTSVYRLLGAVCGIPHCDLQGNNTLPFRVNIIVCKELSALGKAPYESLHETLNPGLSRVFKIVTAYIILQGSRRSVWIGLLSDCTRGHLLYSSNNDIAVVLYQN